MLERTPLLRVGASLLALALVMLEGLLILGGSFGQYQLRHALPPEPEPLTLNFFPYSLFTAATILMLVYAGYVAGISIDSAQYSVRKLQVAGALMVVASSMLLAGLLLVINFEMHSDEVLWWETHAGAYILIGLPIAAAVALLGAMGRTGRA